MEVLDLLGTGETAISLGDAAKLLPLDDAGKKVSIKSILRWIRLGYRGVFLEGIKIGNHFKTSAGALQRFIKKCTEADIGKFRTADVAVAAVAEKSASTKPRAKTKAERELEAAGYGSGGAHRNRRTARKAS